MHATGQVLLALLVIGGAFLVLSRTVSRAAANSRNPRVASRGAAGARLMSPRNMRAAAAAEISRAWAKAQAADWLEQRRHERRHGPASAGGPAAAPAAGPPSARGGRGTHAPSRILRLGGDDVADVLGPPPQQGPAPGVPASSPPGPVSAGHPPVTEGTSPSMAGSGSLEMVIEGLQRLRAEASAGNAHDKHRVMRALSEVGLRANTTAVAISRGMTDQGHYGPEITEPVARSGQHFQAAAMVLGEADTALGTLLGMSLGELARSPRQAPHYRELTETGAP